MSNVEKTGPYVYQPRGIQDKEYWAAQRIYAVVGYHPLARIEGLTRAEAETILLALKEMAHE